jgi:hypothetical protein
MTATEMATEIGERIKHEGEKLRALELVTLPMRKEEPKKGHSKFKMFTLVAMLAGTGYAIFKKVRARATEQAPAFTPPTANRTENGNGQNRPDQPLKTASV